MPEYLSDRPYFILVAVLALATGLAGCAHLSAVVVSQAPADAAGVVVFDVDGTLTPTVARIFSARVDASAVVSLYAERGYRIVYLTARAPALQGALRGFMSRNGFPRGDLVAPKNWAEHAAPAIFKTRALTDYLAHGWGIAAAYGDSSTDFEAYARAGIPRERVFALRRVGARQCQRGVWSACLAGWEQLRQKLLTSP